MTHQDDQRIVQRKHDLAQARGEAFANGRRQGQEEAAAENERLRAALLSIECHELRDHEDYDAIKDIAHAALHGTEQLAGK